MRERISFFLNKSVRENYMEERGRWKYMEAANLT